MSDLTRKTAWLTLGCLLGLSACARSELSQVERRGDGGLFSDSGSDPPDAPPPLPPCLLAAAEPPVALFGFGSHSADASDLAVLDPGSPAAAAPAVVAVKARDADANMWHPEVHVARLRIEPTSVADAVIEEPLTLFAFESHEWATLAKATGGAPADLALLWHYAGALVDPPSLRLQTFDTQSWSPGAPVDVTFDADASLSLVPGPAVSGTSYGGEGWGIAYRGPFDEQTDPQPLVAVLDSTGTMVLGPLAAAPPEDYPGRSVNMVWTGETYLVATSFSLCPTPSPLCTPRSVALARLLPPAASGGSGSLQLAATIGALASLEPRRPYVVEHAGTVWVAWFERPSDDPEAPWTLRLARAGPDGTLLAPPEVITTQAQPTHGLALLASSLGVSLLWPEQGDPTLPPHEPGHAVLVMHHLDLDGAPLGAPFELPVTAVSYYSGLGAAALDYPRGLLLSWSAASQDPLKPSVIYLSQRHCLPP